MSKRASFSKNVLCLGLRAAAPFRTWQLSEEKRLSSSLINQLITGKKQWFWLCLVKFPVALLILFGCSPQTPAGGGAAFFSSPVGAACQCQLASLAHSQILVHVSALRLSLRASTTAKTRSMADASSKSVAFRWSDKFFVRLYMLSSRCAEQTVHQSVQSLILIQYLYVHSSGCLHRQELLR